MPLRFLIRSSACLTFAWTIFFSAPLVRAASIWKVTAPNGASLYLGGSMHGLRSTDYPLPSAYNRAFDESSGLVLEETGDMSLSRARRTFKGGFYPKNDSLKNHVDPRTYAYLRRFFALERVPESEWSKCKAWMLTFIFFAEATNPLGIDAYLLRRARANRKPVLGLESSLEHLEVLSGMSDKQAELALLLNFIPPSGEGSDGRQRLIAEWREGNVDAIARLGHVEFRDLPSFEKRLITDRNFNWLPKIEGYLQHHRDYFVVVGAAHLGGPNGLLALLRSRGYQLKQL